LRDLPVVILVHGMVVSSRYMEPTLAQLAPFCRAYAIDLPGHSKSYKSKRILALPQLVEALAAWMDTAHIVKAHMMGDSFGCQVLAEFALRYPERVHRLVLVALSVDPARRVWSQQLCALLKDSFNELCSIAWISLLDYKAAGLKRACATAKLVLEDRIKDKLPHIRHPRWSSAVPKARCCPSGGRNRPPRACCRTASCAWYQMPVTF
jgi:2-hydroxy-6-oxonona-2,4-dienedioate hydrolase